MTKEEAIKYLEKSESTQFCVYPIDAEDIWGLPGSDDFDFDDEEVQEVYRRTMFSVQRDIENALDIGDAIYYMVGKYMLHVAEAYLKEKKTKMTEEARP